MFHRNQGRDMIVPVHPGGRSNPPYVQLRICGDPMKSVHSPLIHVLQLCLCGLLALGSGCAYFTSYKPVANPKVEAAGFHPVTFKYQETKFFLFKSIKDDAEIERVFVNPYDPKNIILSVSYP